MIERPRVRAVGVWCVGTGSRHQSLSGRAGPAVTAAAQHGRPTSRLERFPVARRAPAGSRKLHPARPFAHTAGADEVTLMRAPNASPNTSRRRQPAARTHWHRCRGAAGLQAPDALDRHLVPSLRHDILGAQLGSMSTSDSPRSVEVGALQGGHVDDRDGRASGARCLWQCDRCIATLGARASSARSVANP